MVFDSQGDTVTNSGGTVRPGDLLSGTTTGTLTINGNYTRQSGGILEIDLAGTGQGTTYDLLTVSGTASLAGKLDVKLLNSFVPTAGEQFNFLTYGSLRPRPSGCEGELSSPVATFAQETCPVLQ